VIVDTIVVPFTAYEYVLGYGPNMPSCACSVWEDTTCCTMLFAQGFVISSMQESGILRLVNWMYVYEVSADLGVF
jgi:hypothetical protein